MNLQENLNHIRRRIQFDKIPSIIDDTIDYYVTPAWSKSKGDFISDVCDYIVSSFSEDNEMEFEPKDKDLFYNFLVDSYGEYLGNRYDEWKKSQDDVLSEQSNRIKSMMGLVSEATPPINLRRRLRMDKVDELFKRYLTSSFKRDKPTEESINEVIRQVTLGLVPYDDDSEFSEEDYNNLYEYLEDYLYGKYKDDLTKYYEKRQADADKEKDDGTKYIFAKHNTGYYDLGLRGQGFSDTFYSFDDLLTKYGHWVDVDWDEVKRKLDNINEYPEKTWKGEESRPLRILSIGDEGNKWGYNFSIVKVKEREY